MADLSVGDDLAVEQQLGVTVLHHNSDASCDCLGQRHKDVGSLRNIPHVGQNDLTRGAAGVETHLAVAKGRQCPAIAEVDLAGRGKGLVVMQQVKAGHHFFFVESVLQQRPNPLETAPQPCGTRVSAEAEEEDKRWDKEDKS